MRYDRVGDGVSVSGDAEDIEVDNNTISDSGNEDNWCTTIEDVVDSVNEITAEVDLTNRVFADVLVHLFNSSSP